MDIYWVSSSIISNLKTSAPFSTSESFEQNIQIYPIPTNGKFNITFGQLSYKNASVKITDIDGRYILSNTYSNLPSILIDLTGYPKGIYILSLTVDGERLSKKIILE
jgi:hypothetical protein